MLYGVGIFGNHYNDDDCYSVTLQILNNEDSVLAATSGTFTSFHMESENDLYPSYYGFNVLFEDPVTLRKDVKYSFKASIDGPTSVAVGKVVNDIHYAGVGFNFTQPCWNNGEEDEEWPLGKIAELLFKVKE
ncbi:hypothetical protein OS493_011300 [Desmophyllum pertusum]|uniref:PHR domain-containing protein n=1 Tax=Desmophyllum pertusum TaxID=174260 RepID=A0A9X0CSB8_9CNID|nr:hypothetical protein OS493_011300 [Desmophyllum pertusum]